MSRLRSWMCVVAVPWLVAAVLVMAIGYGTGVVVLGQLRAQYTAAALENRHLRHVRDRQLSHLLNLEVELRRVKQRTSTLQGRYHALSHEQTMIAQRG